MMAKVAGDVTAAKLARISFGLHQLLYCALTLPGLLLPECVFNTDIAAGTSRGNALGWAKRKEVLVSSITERMN